MRYTKQKQQQQCFFICSQRSNCWQAILNLYLCLIKYNFYLFFAYTCCQCWCAALRAIEYFMCIRFGIRLYTRLVILYNFYMDVLEKGNSMHMILFRVVLIPCKFLSNLRSLKKSTTPTKILYLIIFLLFNWIQSLPDFSKNEILKRLKSWRIKDTEPKYSAYMISI